MYSVILIFQSDKLICVNLLIASPMKTDLKGMVNPTKTREKTQRMSSRGQ
jgi:hypothetical protein